MNTWMRGGLVVAFGGFAIACGGGTTDGDIGTEPPAATPAPAGGESTPAPAAAGPGGKWSEWTTSDLEAALKANGWTVTECYSYTEDNIREDDCDATKGKISVSVELDRYESHADAKWMAEDVEGTRVDGKTVMAVTVYNGEVAETLLNQILPKGTKIIDVKQDAVVTAVKGAGFSIDEQSKSQDDGYVMFDVSGESSTGYVSIDWEYTDGSTGGSEDRDLDGAVASVYQGDDDDLSIYVYDYKMANDLVAALTK
ncbi:MAG: hypothetical protein GY913_23390 [Proteobacteria bacterium]|nr:hypothetical protein [Pseudomonadota bacterium]MCP4919857.1 hypothetical protein [Pseudomonadota bacterium]